VKRTRIQLVILGGALLLGQSILMANGGGRSAPAAAASKITPQRSKGHVDLLASDAMMGRNTPSPELDSAARYIAAKFQEYGLEPVNGSYFHEYALKRDRLGTPNSLAIGDRTFELKNDFIPYDFSGSGAPGGDIVFVGYGLSRPDAGYDDYEEIDVRGKIVLAIAGEPKNLHLKEKGFGLPSDAQPRGKMIQAAKHGAAGFLLMPNPVQYKILRPYGYWPTFYRSDAKLPQPYHLELPLEADPIPSMSVGGEIARSLFGGSIEPMAAMVRSIDSSGHPASKLLRGGVSMEVRIERERLPVRNVIGMIRGSRLPDEYVILGAHYDHVGHSISGHNDHPRDSIFNGADDNASGTTGLLLDAEAFGSLSPEDRPARSIIFLAFSGEEKGLYGSRAYAAHPSVPNARVAAMLNMDMIGRNSPDSISIAGRSRSPELAAMAEEANAAEPMTIAYNLEDMFFRSDQASFADKKIPVLFFSTGEHADYHKVTDSPDKIDNVKLARIARLCFRTAWLVAESPDRPSYHDVVTDDPNAMILDE
jgi:hypothetical protein